MKRCHDCGNLHENEHGWCEPCHSKPPIPKGSTFCNCKPDFTRTNILKDKKWVCRNCLKLKNDGYGGFYCCTLCSDSGRAGGCFRCGRGVIEREDW